MEYFFHFALLISLIVLARIFVIDVYDVSWPFHTSAHALLSWPCPCLVCNLLGSLSVSKSLVTPLCQYTSIGRFIGWDIWPHTPQLYTHRTHPYRPRAFWLRVCKTPISYMPTHHTPSLATHLSAQAHQPHPLQSSFALVVSSA
jgi:hypothetical protein